MMQTYSSQNVSPTLLDEITQAMKNVGSYGSIEIYIQNHLVTQITIRNIKKTLSDAKKFDTRHV